jgi:truncated hemoglobin YjbI
MTNLTKVVASLQSEYSRLQKEMERVGKALGALGHANGNRSGRRILSKEARERIAEAQRQRWAKVRKAKSKS